MEFFKHVLMPMFKWSYNLASSVHISQLPFTHITMWTCDSTNILKTFSCLKDQLVLCHSSLHILGKPATKVYIISHISIWSKQRVPANTITAVLQVFSPIFEQDQYYFQYYAYVAMVLNLMQDFFKLYHIFKTYLWTPVCLFMIQAFQS